MSRINSKTVFVTTSPRSPARMIPEIALLARHFSGQPWNADTQRQFMELLREEEFFNGQWGADPAFSARDRINRAPKSLGFVSLAPVIQLTPAGERLLAARKTEDVFLRQLLKFQLPSPFHRPWNNSAKFRVRPYLEVVRLIRTLGTLRFDELMLFGLQLTDWRHFGETVSRIDIFRAGQALNKGRYKRYLKTCLDAELASIYAEDLASWRIKTRETRLASTAKFLRTKAANLRDYTDACVRYLRATGLVEVSHIGHSLSIAVEKVDDVDYILANTERSPVFVDDEQAYAAYLGSADTPRLLTDDRQALLRKLDTEFPTDPIDRTLSIGHLQEALADLFDARKTDRIWSEIDAIKSFRHFDDILNTFKQIEDNSLYDAPLMLEWNTWRAMTMLDGGDIRANLKLDDQGHPISTAQGNMADIVCDYGSFALTVEVTLQRGQKQYETEGEPVARHLAKLKRESQKPAFCLFVAPSINDAVVAHFYALQRMNITYYGWVSTIVPLPLAVFRKMVIDARHSSYRPGPDHVRRFFELTQKIALASGSEKDRYEQITKLALDRLSPPIHT